MSTQRTSRFCSELKARIPNLPSCLLALYMIPMRMAMVCALRAANPILVTGTKPSCYTMSNFDSHSLLVVHCLVSAAILILLLLYPLTGWIADTKVGHKRFIDISLWLTWIGLMLQIVSECIQYATCGLPVAIAIFGISALAALLIYIGTMMFQVAVFACGMDQLVDCSNTKLRAFIHWLVIAYAIGDIGVTNIYSIEESIVLNLALEITCVVLLTAMLIVNILLKHKFYPSGVVQSNPYRTIYDVLKYSIRNKGRQHSRSAFTYWEEDIPGRIDLGKEKYGGPFTEDTVETVKTFLRIIAVVTSISLVFIVYSNYFIYSGQQELLLITSSNIMIATIIILAELIIVPLFPKIEYFLTNSLKWIGVAFIITIAGLIYLNIVVIFISDTTTCGVSENLFYLLPYYIIQEISLILVLIYLFEFVCSQAPHNMIAMMTGVFWAFPSIFTPIGYFIELPLLWYEVHGPGNKLTCSFWAVLVQVVVCVVGFIIYTAVARWYSWRLRETNPNIQGMIENKYDNYLSRINDNTHFLISTVDFT